MTEHRIWHSRGPNGETLSHVDLVPDAEEVLRKELGGDPFDEVAKRAQRDIDKAMKAARMYAPPPGLTVDIGDYDMHTIGGSSR